MYDIVKMGMLCFYFCIKIKNGVCFENKEDEFIKKLLEDLEIESDNEFFEIEEIISDVESIRDFVFLDLDVIFIKRLKLFLILICLVLDNYEIGIFIVRIEELLLVLMDSFNEVFFNIDVEIIIEEVMLRSLFFFLEEKLVIIVYRVKVLEEFIEMFKSL